MPTIMDILMFELNYTREEAEEINKEIMEEKE